MRRGLLLKWLKRIPGSLMPVSGFEKSIFMGWFVEESCISLTSAICGSGASCANERLVAVAIKQNKNNEIRIYNSRRSIESEVTNSLQERKIRNYRVKKIKKKKKKGKKMV